LPEAWTDPLLQPKEWKNDIRFGVWNVMSLHRSGSFTTVATELARYKLDLVGVQEVWWDKWGTDKQGIIFLSLQRESKFINWEQNFWYKTK
jgi:hypothetical protein